MNASLDPTDDGHEEIEEVHAGLPTEEQLYFRERGWEAITSAPNRLDGIAKTFPAVLSAITPIYFAAVAFSNIRVEAWWVRLLAFSPVLLWIAAVGCALKALLPRVYWIHGDAPDSVRDYFEKGARRKLMWVRRCGWLTFAGLALLVLTLVLYLFVLTPTPPAAATSP